MFDRLLFTRVANSAPSIYLLQNPAPLNINNGFMPDLPHEACFFFPSTFSPNNVPSHQEIVQKNILPLSMSKLQGRLALLKDAFANFDIVL